MIAVSGGNAHRTATSHRKQRSWGCVAHDSDHEAAVAHDSDHEAAVGGERRSEAAVGPGQRA
jgi:hypothetical protein